MFTGFIKCDCNGVCIEVNPFICTTSTSTSTTTSTSTSTTTTTTTIAITSICFCIYLEGGGCVYQVELPILGNAPFQNGRPVYNITGEARGEANGTVYYNGTQWIYASEENAPLLQPLLNSSYYPIGTYFEWGEVDTTYFMNSSTSGSCSTTTTTTTTACNRWQYEYLSYTCTTCEIIEYSSLYNSNPLTLDNFYQYGDIVITPFTYLGCDTGVSDASIPDTGVATCEEIDCSPTTTTSTTTRLKICKIYGLQALTIDGGSWSAITCLGESVGGILTESGTEYTPCIDIDTLVMVNGFIKQEINC